VTFPLNIFLQGGLDNLCPACPEVFLREIKVVGRESPEVFMDQPEQGAGTLGFQQKAYDRHAGIALCNKIFIKKIGKLKIC
jgi:hypothetical protein